MTDRVFKLFSSIAKESLSGKYLHILVDNTAGLWEGTISILSTDHPINGSLKDFVINEDVRFGLMEGLHNKSCQPFFKKRTRWYLQVQNYCPS